MRVNKPVSRQEYPIERDTTLQSTTDTHGNITYANAAFVRASGFDYQDLLSKPHNMVAGEVRNLAQRSSTAAKEIKQLIETSVERVRDGSTQVQHASATMDNIVEQAGQVSTLISEISTSTHDQTQALGQINQSIGQLNQMTH